MDTPEIPDPATPEPLSVTPRRPRFAWWPLALLLLAGGVVGGGWYYCDSLGPNLAATRTRTEIEHDLPNGTSADAVMQWLAARQVRTETNPRPGSNKRWSISGRIPRQYGPRYSELWLEFYFDDQEKLTRYEVTVHSPEV